VEIAAMRPIRAIKNGLTTDANGNKHWYFNGRRHRIDGPAIEYTDESSDWYFNGRRHRIDGPAIEYTNGIKIWYLNDKLHRIDGPATELVDGTIYWYLNGVGYSFEKYIIAANWSDEQIIMWKLLQ
jgi:hypothetical protein